jgi:hypothetical protein
MAAEATTGIEPVKSASRGLEPNLSEWLRGLEPSVRVYMEAFGVR